MPSSITTRRAGLLQGPLCKRTSVPAIVGRWRTIATLLATVGVVTGFVLDISLPFGWASWLLYLPTAIVLPVFHSERSAVAGVTVCSGLIVGFFFYTSSEGVPSAALFSRMVGLISLWSIFFVARGYKRIQTKIATQEAKVHLYAELEQRVTERTTELVEQKQRLQAVLDTTVEGIITIDVRGTVESMNRAAEEMFGYNANEVVGNNVNMLMPSPYRDQHDGYIARYRDTGEARIIGIGREIVGLRKGGEVFPMDLSIIETKVGDRSHYTGLIRDLTERKRLEAAVTSTAEEERGRMARDLHDGLGQELSGVLFLIELLKRDLEERAAPEAVRAAQIVLHVKEALASAREISIGLFPVPPEPDGLMAALQNLADRVTRNSEIECRFDVDSSVLIDEPALASHLYRLAQEAVNNAIKHSGTSRIDVCLKNLAGQIELVVRDYGKGLARDEKSGDGLGLQTMRFRAQMLGAQFTLEHSPEGGTLVRCVAPHYPTASSNTGELETSSLS